MKASPERSGGVTSIRVYNTAGFRPRKLIDNELTSQSEKTGGIQKMINFCVNLFKWFKTIVCLSNINKKNILSNNITLNNEKIFWDKGYNIIKCSCGTMILARANFKYYKDTYHKPTMTKIVILPHNIPDTNDICPEGINLYSCLNILNK